MAKIRQLHPVVLILVVLQAFSMPMSWAEPDHEKPAASQHRKLKSLESFIILGRTETGGFKWQYNSQSTGQLVVEHGQDEVGRLLYKVLATLYGLQQSKQPSLSREESKWFIHKLFAYSDRFIFRDLSTNLAILIEGVYQEISGDSRANLVAEVSAERKKTLDRGSQQERIGSAINRHFVAHYVAKNPKEIRLLDLDVLEIDSFWMDMLRITQTLPRLYRPYVESIRESKRDLFAHSFDTTDEALNRLRRLSNDQYQGKVFVSAEAMISAVASIIEETLSIHQNKYVQVAEQLQQPINLVEHTWVSDAVLNTVVPIIFPPKYATFFKSVSELAARLIILDEGYKKLKRSHSASLVRDAMVQVFYQAAEKIDDLIADREKNRTQNLEAAELEDGYGLALRSLIGVASGVELSTPANILHNLGGKLSIEVDSAGVAKQTIGNSGLPYRSFTDEQAVMVFDAVVKKMGGIHNLSQQQVYNIYDELVAIDDAVFRVRKQRPIAAEINRTVGKIAKELMNDYDSARNRLAHIWGVVGLASTQNKQALYAQLNSDDQKLIAAYVGHEIVSNYCEEALKPSDGRRGKKQ